MTRRGAFVVSVVAALGLVLAACSARSTSPGTTAVAGATSTTAPSTSLLDRNGDGTVRFGVAAAGSRDDGAYNQALVDTIERFSAANGYAAPVVVDDISPDDAATQLTDLAEQGVDVVTVGAGDIADPLPGLVATYADILWYCNCGAGYPATPGLAQSQDDSSEISFTAGYATGLLLRERGGDAAAFIGCCDLNFEREAFMAFEAGLQAVDPAITATYMPSGAFRFDFDNTAGATAAFEAALGEGVDAVYPYLGAAHEPVVALADEAGVIVMSAGSSTACARTDLTYQIEVRYDASDYLDTVLAELQAGTMREGEIRVFRVGVDPQPGARICRPSTEQQAEMDAVYARIAAGEFAALFGEIKGTAYSG